MKQQYCTLCNLAYTINKVFIVFIKIFFPKDNKFEFYQLSVSIFALLLQDIDYEVK